MYLFDFMPISDLQPMSSTQSPDTDTKCIIYSKSEFFNTFTEHTMLHIFK